MASMVEENEPETPGNRTLGAIAQRSRSATRSTRSIRNRSTRGIRGLVSKKKIRFTEDGFDLDLTHITPQIIAMGFPSAGSEAIYRNSATEVLDYFDSTYDGRYKFYNLCSERSYDPATFHGRVAHIPFDDHNPPKMPQFRECCEDMHAWLSADPGNVVAVHCKAGKGRTGTIIAAYLVYAGICKTPSEALAFFGKQRTSNGKGVTIPSQKRFVKYFGKALKAQRAQMRKDMRAANAKNAAVFARLPEVADVAGASESPSRRSVTPETVPWYQAWFCFRMDEIQRQQSAAEIAKEAQGSQEELAPLPSPPPPPSPLSTPGLSARTGWGSDSAGEEDEEEEEDDSMSEADSDDDEGGWGDGGYEGTRDDHTTDGTEKVVEAKEAGRMDRKVLALITAERSRLATLTPSYPPLSFNELVPLPCPRVIVGLSVVTTPHMSRLGGYSPSFSVACGDVVYKSKDFMQPARRIRRRAATRFELSAVELAVVNEVRIDLYHTTTVRGKRKKMTSFWFHTSFVEGNELRLGKPDLDKICKDKRHRKYDEGIQVVVHFVPR